MSPQRRRSLLRQQAKRRAQRAKAHREAELAKTPVREVSMTELARQPATVVRAVRDGELIVLSKHKRAVAMIVPLLDEYSLDALDSTSLEALPTLAGVFEERRKERSSSAFMHGRMFGRRHRR